MSVSRLIAAALISAATATPASADVTLQRKVRGQMPGSVAQDEEHLSMLRQRMLKRGKRSR